jgi:hypothetical protein
MNLLGIQDVLKNASDQQLMQLMRSPDSTAPSYLVLSELNRRKEMRAKQAQPPQGTVAQDLTSEENMQAPMGIRSLSTPEPGDEDYPTEEDAPGIEAMRKGGIVRMAAGDEVEGLSGQSGYDDGYENQDMAYGQDVTGGGSPAPPPTPSRAQQFFGGIREAVPGVIQQGQRLVGAGLQHGQLLREANPLTYLFGDPARHSENAANAEWLRSPGVLDRIRRGELDINTIRENTTAARLADLAKQPFIPEPRPEQFGPPFTPAPPPSSNSNSNSNRQPQTTAAPQGVRGVGAPVARPAAQPEALPTLQQNMERNLGMFPGIPQELMDRIRSSRTNEGERRREAQNMALIEAGLRMASSNNPRLGAAFAEGAAPAVQSYGQQLSQIRQDQNADITRELAVAEADLRRRYMVGQISASEYQRQTQLLVSRDDRAARLEVARIAAGNATANTNASLAREDLRHQAALDRSQAERTGTEVLKALGDQGTRAAAAVALRGNNRDITPTNDQIDTYIRNRVTAVMNAAYTQAARLPTSRNPRENADVVQPPGER